MKTLFFAIIGIGFSSATLVADTVDQWEVKAAQKYPDLTVKDSPANRAFVAEVAARRSNDPQFFEASNWPMVLADEVEAKLGLRGAGLGDRVDLSGETGDQKSMKTTIATMWILVAVSALAGDLDNNRKDALPSQALKLPPAMVWQGVIVHPSWVVLADDKHVVFGTSENRQISVPLPALPQNVKRALDVQIRIAQNAKHEDVPLPTINGQVQSKEDGGLLITTAEGRTVFLKGYPGEGNAVDQDAIRVYATEAGTFQYETVAGTKATVRAYQFTGDYKE
jgi:hypothetical protein